MWWSLRNLMVSKISSHLLPSLDSSEIRMMSMWLSREKVKASCNRGLSLLAFPPEICSSKVLTTLRSLVAAYCLRSSTCLVVSCLLSMESEPDELHLVKHMAVFIFKCIEVVTVFNLICKVSCLQGKSVIGFLFDKVQSFLPSRMLVRRSLAAHLATMIWVELGPTVV